MASQDANGAPASGGQTIKALKNFWKVISLHKKNDAFTSYHHRASCNAQKEFYYLQDLYAEHN